MIRLNMTINMVLGSDNIKIPFATKTNRRGIDIEYDKLICELIINTCYEYFILS